MLREVIDGLGVVKEAVENVVAVVQAVRDGRDYLKQNYPEARKDVELMLLELRKNLVLIADVSGVLTRFRFDANDNGLALQRFNDYYIQQSAKTVAAKQGVDQLRSRCSAVREHAGNVSEGLGMSAFQRFFEKLNVAAALRRGELATILDRLSYEDFANARAADKILECGELALGHVQRALETNGLMQVTNVPAAAALLREYAQQFEPLGRESQATASTIDQLAQELRGA
jgi:hypothetical protein